MENVTVRKRVFNVEISESLIRCIRVIAASEVDAIEKIAEKYNNSEIILDAEDFVGVNFSVKRERSSGSLNIGQ